MRPFILSLLLATMVLSGCMFLGAEEQNVTENVTPAPPPKPVVKPSFSITSPLDGELMTLSGESYSVSITLTTSNLLLKSPGGAAKNGEGHFSISTDGGQAYSSSSKVYTIDGLSEGTHTVEVELLNNDGTGYAPAITDSVTFTIEKETPPEYMPQAYTVSIKGNAYEPAELTVKVSDSVTFVNEGSTPQSATCFVGGKQVFDTKILSSGQSATITMDSEVECEYYSTMYRAMTGKLTVESKD